MGVGVCVCVCVYVCVCVCVLEMVPKRGTDVEQTHTRDGERHGWLDNC